MELLKLQTFLMCIPCFSVTVIKYNDQSNLKKGKLMKTEEYMSIITTEEEQPASARHRGENMRAHMWIQKQDTKSK